MLRSCCKFWEICNCLGHTEFLVARNNFLATRNAFLGRDPKAESDVLREFYTMWKKHFPDLRITPADWARSAAKDFRNPSGTFQHPVGSNLFFGKLREASRGKIGTQKALAVDHPSKIFPKAKQKTKVKNTKMKHLVFELIFKH